MVRSVHGASTTPGLIGDSTDGGHESGAELSERPPLAGTRSKREVDCATELTGKIPPLAAQRGQIDAGARVPAAGDSGTERVGAAERLI